MTGRSARAFRCAFIIMLVASCADATPPAELRTNTVLETNPPEKPVVASVPSRAPIPAHKAPPPVAEPADTAPVAANEGVDQLIGLNENEIQAALGVPMLQEDRAPTKLWVFRNRNCTINVTLYPDVKTREFHALSYEVISDVHTAERTRSCIAELSARFPPK